MRGPDRKRTTSVAWPRSAVAALALVQLGGAAGCAGGEGGASFAQRDSAGVTIVQNSGPTWSAGQEWRLAAEPAVDIGVLEGEEEYQLFGVGGAIRLTDGRIVVANGGTGELRYYDADGRFIKSVGGKGEGPGEFESMGVLSLVGDSIFVYDFRLRRMSVFHTEGDFGRSFPVSVPGGGFPIPSGTFDDGTVLATTGFSFRPSRVEGVFRDTSVYALVGRDGEVRDSVGLFPSMEFYMSGTERSAMAVGLVFGRSSYGAVRGRSAYIGVSDRHEIFRYDSNGRLDGIIRTSHEPVRVTEDDIERAKADRLEGVDDANARRNVERMFGDMPIPETMPAFAGFMVDESGYLWVLDHAAPGADSDHWSLYEPGGKLLGTVVVPARFRMLEIGNDYVLGVGWDELDVQHVRMYELVKPEA